MKTGSIIIVSGGIGYSAQQLVRTALAQFPDADVSVVRIPQVRTHEQIANAIQQAATCGGLIAHTLVDSGSRAELQRLAQAHAITTIDLIGPLLDHLSSTLGQQPLGQPGRFDEQNKSYLDRITAIEYTLAHDDGTHPEEWEQAEILLTGVSRVGKTPLSTYLAVLGWRVANLPLIPEIPPPRELFALEHCRVIGLTIGLEQLIEHRRRRQQRLGIPLGSSYCSPAALSDELEMSDKLFRRSGFPVVDVTNKPLESIANEVIALVEHMPIRQRHTFSSA